MDNIVEVKDDEESNSDDMYDNKRVMDNKMTPTVGDEDIILSNINDAALSMKFEKEDMMENNEEENGEEEKDEIMETEKQEEDGVKSSGDELYENPDDNDGGGGVDGDDKIMGVMTIGQVDGRTDGQLNDDED